MKWNTRNQDREVSLKNLDVITDEHGTPVAYVGNTYHSELIRSAPEQKEQCDILKNTIKEALSELEEYGSISGGILREMQEAIA